MIIETTKQLQDFLVWCRNNGILACNLEGLGAFTMAPLDMKVEKQSEYRPATNFRDLVSGDFRSER